MMAKSTILAALAIVAGTARCELGPETTWGDVPPSTTIYESLVASGGMTITNIEEALTSSTNYTDAATNALEGAMSGAIGEAAQAGTNYTDAAVAALADSADRRHYTNIVFRSSRGYEKVVEWDGNYAEAMWDGTGVVVRASTAQTVRWYAGENSTYTATADNWWQTIVDNDGTSNYGVWYNIVTGTGQLATDQTVYWATNAIEERLDERTDEKIQAVSNVLSEVDEENYFSLSNYTRTATNYIWRNVYGTVSNAVEKYAEDYLSASNVLTYAAMTNYVKSVGPTNWYEAETRSWVEVVPHNDTNVWMRISETTAMGDMTNLLFDISYDISNWISNKHYGTYGIWEHQYTHPYTSRFVFKVGIFDPAIDPQKTRLIFEYRTISGDLVFSESTYYGWGPTTNLWAVNSGQYGYYIVECGYRAVMGDWTKPVTNRYEVALTDDTPEHSGDLLGAVPAPYLEPALGLGGASVVTNTVVFANRSYLENENWVVDAVSNGQLAVLGTPTAAGEHFYIPFLSIYDPANLSFGPPSGQGSGGWTSTNTTLAALLGAKASASALEAHINDLDNPHEVTASQVPLSLQSGNTTVGEWAAMADQFLGTLPVGSDIMSQDIYGNLYKGSASSQVLTTPPKINGTSLALAAYPVTAGNLAALDAQGNPVDSGKSAADFLSAAPLAGRTYNFATTQGVMDALAAVIATLGGTVTNNPSTTAE